MPPEKQPWGRLRQKSEVFFPLADQAIVAHHVAIVPPGICPGLIQNNPSAIVISDKVRRTSTLLASPFGF